MTDQYKPLHDDTHRIEAMQAAVANGRMGDRNHSFKQSKEQRARAAAKETEARREAWIRRAAHGIH